MADLTGQQPDQYTMTVGNIIAACSRVSGGKHFRTIETECIAKGDEACLFLIDKRPVGE